MTNLPVSRPTNFFEHVSDDPNPGCEHIFLYRGVRVSQSRLVFEALSHLATSDELLNDPPARVIEIGTLYGGFTRILREHDVSLGADLISYDIVNTLVGVIPQVTFKHVDVYSPVGVQQLTDDIQSPGRTLLFCDGGDKEKEINTFASRLKRGDIILCHDYLKDPSLFMTEANGFWPGHESHWENIKDALTAASCVPFLEAEMQRAVWGCFIRQ